MVPNLSRSATASRSPPSGRIQATTRSSVSSVRLPRIARGFLKQSARVCGFVKHGLTSGLIEGFNNLIARIIHKACGMKDLDYLELKLRHCSVRRA
jgi:transposase